MILLGRARWLLIAACAASLAIGCEELAGIEDLRGGDSTNGGGAGAHGSDLDDASTNVGKSTPPIDFFDATDDGALVVTLKDAGAVTPTLSFPRRIALGSTHSCAIDDSERVMCWGSNASGQLGQGAPPTSADARAVTGAVHAKTIASGAAHTCAVDADGAVLCWGRSDQGQLGGKPTELGAIVKVNTNGERARQVAAGALHTCVLLETSGVRCWGDNAFGQLGDGTRNASTALVAPAGLDSSIVAVFAGGFFTCALKKNGALTCWGDNTFGQIGDRTKNTRPAPVGVLDLTSQTRELSLGQNAVCAVGLGGSLDCWGRNRPLGEPAAHGIVVPFPPSPTDLSSPTHVGADAGLALLHSVALNANHACARSLAGHALCWGSNAKLQLGVAANTPPSPITGFVDVTELAGLVKEIAVGFTHSCAFTNDNDVYCWGGNEYGQLGTSAGAPRSKPERVASFGAAQ